MKLKGIAIPGFVIDKKTGKPKRSTRGKSVSQKIAERKSNKIKVARRSV